MDTADFDFQLPDHLIAQAPVTPRDAARLLVWPGASEEPRHRSVRDLPAELAPGDLLVVNDTRVLHARVLAERETGGRVEMLFLEAAAGHEPGAWRAMVKPAKKMKPGMRVRCSSSVEAEFLEREAASGYWRVRLIPEGGSPPNEGETHALLQQIGAVPLPPYIERSPTVEDEERYQTVYAAAPGAVAAPTAGLHVTDELLHALGVRGVEVARVTLHVGAGTFLPVTVDRVEEHRMHAERYVLGDDVEGAVRRCRERGGRVVALGTTSARVLESCAVESGAGGGTLVRAASGETDIFMRPGGLIPRVCDGLMTNFHLPKSTLLMLVAAFIGFE
ncbi:MAG: tRNA preQ1(34) S-adenosylmethionine ribosyltransferase-isomerase QueA, partial [Planctomycetota bacterium]